MEGHTSMPVPNPLKIMRPALPLHATVEGPVDAAMQHGGWLPGLHQFRGLVHEGAEFRALETEGHARVRAELPHAHRKRAHIRFGELRGAFLQRTWEKKD